MKDVQAGSDLTAVDKVVAQASSPAGPPGVTPGFASGSGGGTPPEPAGEDACATSSTALASWASCPLSGFMACRGATRGLRTSARFWSAAGSAAPRRFSLRRLIRSLGQSPEMGGSASRAGDSLLRKIHRDLLNRDPRDGIGIRKRKGQFHLLKVPTLDELQRAVNRLEIESLTRIFRPFIRPLKVSPVGNFS